MVSTVSRVTVRRDFLEIAVRQVSDAINSANIVCSKKKKKNGQSMATTVMQN